MSFVRPEARAAIWRWREVLIGALSACLALGWAFGSFGLVQGIALILLLVSLLLIFAGIQRARFRGRGGGQGVVQVIEGQVSYFGPLTGGAIAMSELAALSLDGSAKPSHWLLVPEQGEALQIPVSAEGADALFDAFTGLPGLKTEHLLRIKQTQAARISVIWRRDDVQKRIDTLH